MRKDLDVNFVILLETHISSVWRERVRNRLGLNGNFEVKARRQSGGIWCMWDSNLCKVEVLSHNFQTVHMKIKDRNANQWLLTAVYGSPNRGFRKSLWEDLHNIGELEYVYVEDFQQVLEDWNHNVFGNIQCRKSNILRRFQGIKNNLIMNLNLYLEKLQRDLWEEYEEIMAQEELLWFRKSRCNWLEFGDRNTKFFHGSTMARKRRNQIEALQDDNGYWVHDRTTLERIATSFYSRLYTKDAPNTPFVLKNYFPPLDTDDLASIGSNISQMEIKSILFYMGRLKAPGKDGIQAIFYQKKCESVGTDLCRLVERIFSRPLEVWDINETLITLIPKVKPIVSLKQMHPISLCNVSYKSHY
ncbi:uncharacterized protein [Arachis hypogaea]|uniref:uncharacterized protein n=1 Tax=Arachis hypogaea TaxID=3818 RepID=UPI003B2268A8